MRQRASMLGVLLNDFAQVLRPLKDTLGKPLPLVSGLSISVHQSYGTLCRDYPAGKSRVERAAVICRSDSNCWQAALRTGTAAVLPLVRGVATTPQQNSQGPSPGARSRSGTSPLSATGEQQFTRPRIRYPPRKPLDVSPDRFRTVGEDSAEQIRTERPVLLQRQIAISTGGKMVYPQPQNKPAPPWTPTRLLQKRKVYPKRMGFMMQELEKEKEAQLIASKNYPNFGPGSVLELTVVQPENKNKTSIIKGICIARRNKGVRTSFILLNHLGTFGQIERIFPLYSPHIRSIKVYEHRKVRRAKLYYLRDRHPKDYRVG